MGFNSVFKGLTWSLVTGLHNQLTYEAVLTMRFHNQNHVLVRQRTNSPYLIINLITLSVSHRALTDNVSIYTDWYSSI